MNKGNRLIGVDGKKPLILVVDDTPTNLLVVSGIVENEGGSVRVAKDGQSALRLAQLLPRPDLILLDIMMPEMDGHAVLAKLRKNPMTRDIPVIFVTALTTPQEEERGISEGAVDFVTKPVQPSVLIARARAHIELARSQQLLSNQKDWLEQEVSRRSTENLRLENRLQLALDGTGFGIWEQDLISRRNRWSEGLRHMFGYSEEPATIEEYLALVHPEERHLVEAQLLSPRRADEFEHPQEFRLRHQNGNWRWVEARRRSLDPDADGRPRLIIGTLLDITARKESEAERQLADLVFTGITDGICITDAERNILRVNKAFTHITGYEADEVLGQNPRLLRSGNHDHAFFRYMWEKLDRYDNWQGEIINRRKDGSLSNEWLSISCVRNATGEISHYVGLFADLSERQAAAERIQYLSSYDTLTSLPNRALFSDRLDQSLLTARRFVRGTALILLDLDRFRLINDTLGPPIGDQILVEIARRLSLQVREGDTVGRLSGNEFGFVMANLGHERDALALAQRILDAIAVPFNVAGQSLSVTGSIGISVFPKNGEDGEAMLKSADAALLRAKQGGRNTFRFYSPEMDADAARRLAIETAMRDALANQEFSVFYQPQISLESGQMIGMEAR